MLANEQIEAAEAIQCIEEQLEIEHNKIAQWQHRNKELFQKREHISPEYGWIPALLFLGAGILFILGDISVTSDITSTGFDMTKEEGRLFAIGLALTVFLIKPLLDRLFEKPFQKAGFELKRVYRNVLLLITTLGLAMLFFLGQFRADSKTMIAQLNQVTTQQGQPNLQTSDILKLQTQADQISKELAENWWGQWGIVLSTIVFAIGGAMCLAVAFPSLTHLCNKYWLLPFRRWINKFLIRAKEKTVSNARAKREKEKVKHGKAANGLAQLNIPALTELVRSASLKQLDLIEAYYAIRYSKEGELYKDGFNRGWLYSLEGDLKFRVIDPLNTRDKESGATNGNKAGGNPETNEKRAYTRRPFVKIRKMIADNYNNKQNHSNQDGTEFEIVS